MFIIFWRFSHGYINLFVTEGRNSASRRAPQYINLIAYPYLNDNLE